MSMQIPPAKLPHISLPSIRSIPSIPGVGCSGGDTTTLIGEQFGNMPDLDAVRHIKARKKYLQEQIETLIEGYVPAAARQPVWAERVEGYVEDISELLAEMNELISGVVAEATAAINFINGKINELNTAKEEIENTSEESRSAVQRLALGRINEYVVELNEQIIRLEATKSCIEG